MTHATSCPQIVHDVQSYSVVQEKSFSIKIAALFKPDDGSLNFYIKEQSLPWLHLDQQQGVLSGVAPRVPYNKRFKFTLTACNEMGYVTKSFILVVMDTEVVETMPHTLELILSMRNQDYGYSHLNGYTPPLLEYIYQYFQQPDYLDQFNASVHTTAAEQGVKLSDKVSYEEFAGVLKKINPGLEELLAKNIEKDSVLKTAAVNKEELKTLFQFSRQIPGSVIVPIWNHCGFPDIYNWPEWQTLSNVIHGAAVAMKKLKQQNMEEVQHHTPHFKV